jgi:dATP pyrophosphohydrolase
MPKIQSKYIECYIYSIKKKKIKYLLLKRSLDNKVHPGIWQIVTGRIENKEKALNAALRELKEETGLEPIKFFIIPKVTNFYSIKSDTMNIIPLFLALTEYKEINLSKEHSKYKWRSIEKAIKKLHWISQKENLHIINEFLTNKNLKNTFIEVNLSNL